MEALQTQIVTNPQRAVEGELLQVQAPQGLDAASMAEPRYAPVVAGRHLWRRFGRGDASVEALKDLSIDIWAGTFTAIMGPSGSGKSTLLHILAGLDRPTSGSVAVSGVEITCLGDRQLTLLRREKIGFVFQFFNLLPMLTAEENIVLPLRIAGKPVDRPLLDQLLRTIGLEERTTHRPAALSGGQQQRVAIARALVTRPAVVFADEPTGNLDSNAGRQVLSVMRDAVAQIGQTIVMVTHDPSAASMADRVIFLKDGSIVRDEGRLARAQILDALKV
jgi:putative ABC transport system ATP-binding protein